MIINYWWLFTTKKLDLYQDLTHMIHLQGEQGCLLQMLCNFEGWILLTMVLQWFPCYKCGIYVYPAWKVLKIHFSTKKILFLS